MTPTIGRIVFYRIAEYDLIAYEAAVKSNQLKPGNSLSVGDLVPAIIVRTWGALDTSAVNLKLMLDGPDCYWVTSRTCGEKLGQWIWPPRV